MTYYTPEQWRGTSLGAHGRNALRAAVAAHSGWPAHRASLGLSDTGQLLTSELIDVALALSIDIGATTGRTPDGATPNAAHVALAAAQEDGAHVLHRPRPHGPDAVNHLRARFVARSTREEMTVKQRKFVSDVLKTIEQKQDDRATVKQFDAIVRILDRADKRAAAVAAVPVPTFAPKPAVAQEPAPMNAHTPAPTADAANQLAGLIAQLAGQAMNPDAVRELVQREIKAALENGPVLRIEVKGQDGQVRKLEGKQHPKMPSLLRAASARMADGFAPNIWISGPAGSGKTHSAKQVAEALGLPFHMHGAAAMAYELLGFIDAGGVYHRTAFRDAFEHGGVVLWDEIDAWDNSAMLAMKAALGNGQCRFPDATVKRHPDCIIIGCANTFGLGATADYVGRAKIDAALLSSFPVRLFWQYDEALEAAICGNPDWARRVQKARDRAAAAGLKVLIDPRASQAGAALIAAGASFDEAAAETYLANLTADQRRLVEG